MIGILIRLIVLLSFLIFFGWVLGGFYLDAVVRQGLEQVGPQITGTAVSVERVNLSLVLGRGRIRGLAVSNPEGFETARAYYVPNARITFSPASVVQGKLVIDRVVLENPEVTYEINLSGNNLDRITEHVRAFRSRHRGKRGGTNGREPEGDFQYVQINHFIVKNPKLNVSATILGGRSIAFDLDEIHLRDIGKGSRGATVDDATSRVLASTVNAVRKVVSKSGEIVTKDARRIEGGASRQGQGRGGDERAAKGLKEGIDRLAGALQSVRDALGKIFKEEKDFRP